MTGKKWRIAACAAIAGLSMTSAFAQDGTALAATTEYRDLSHMANPHPLLFPTAASLFAPVGFGTNLGTVFGSLSLVDRWPGGSKSDGSLSLGAGLGDGDKYVGFQATALIDSIGVQDNGFAKNGSFSFKAFRWLSPDTSVSLGVANTARWGALKTFSNSYYGSATHYFSFFADHSFPIAATFGAGTGAFYSTAMARSNKDDEIKPFGALSISVLPQLSVIGDYTSDIWSAGLSAVPWLKFPFAVTAYATNLGGGHKVSGRVTYGIRFAVGYAFA